MRNKPHIKYFNGGWIVMWMFLSTGWTTPQPTVCEAWILYLETR